MPEVASIPRPQPPRFSYIYQARLVFKKAGISGHNELARLIAEFAFGWDGRAWLKTLTLLPFGDMGEIKPGLNHQVYYVHSWKHWQELYWYGDWQQPKFFLSFRRKDDGQYHALINYSTRTISLIDQKPILPDYGSIHDEPRLPDDYLLEDMAPFITESPRKMEVAARQGAEIWQESHESEAFYEEVGEG